MSNEEKIMNDVTVENKQNERLPGKFILKDLRNPEGIVIGKKKDENGDEKAVCISEDSEWNKNVAVFGPSGIGKTASFTLPNVLTRIDQKESFIVTDVTGEIYGKTAKIAEKSGYEVKRLNLCEPEKSAGFEMLKPLKEHANDPNLWYQSEVLAEIIASGKHNIEEAFYWGMEINLLQALLLYVAASKDFQGDENERNMGAVYKLLCDIIENEADIDVFSNLSITDPARDVWNIYKGCTKRMQEAICASLITKLFIFRHEEIMRVVSDDDMDIPALLKRPCAYYITYPVQSKHKYAPIVSAFINQMFSQLIEEREKAEKENERRPVYVILDEFPSLGTINSFEMILANVRRYDIRIQILFQSMPQLENLYGKDGAAMILSCCSTWLTRGVDDVDTLHMLTEKGGVQHKVRTETFGSKSLKVKYQEVLMEYEKLTDSEKVCVFANRLEPFKIEPYCYKEHMLSEEI